MRRTSTAGYFKCPDFECRTFFWTGVAETIEVACLWDTCGYFYPEDAPACHECGTEMVTEEAHAPLLREWENTEEG